MASANSFPLAIRLRHTSEGPKGSGGCWPQAMSYNWERFYAWEKHPMLNNNLRHALPGFKYGFGAFLLYVVYDKVAHSGKKAHH